MNAAEAHELALKISSAPILEKIKERANFGKFELTLFRGWEADLYCAAKEIAEALEEGGYRISESPGCIKISWKRHKL